MNIEFHNVQKIYNKKIVLNNFNLKINKNALYLFLGKNGSGKSTTIKILTKEVLYKNNPLSFFKTDVSKVSYLPEKYIVPKMMKIKDFLMLFLGIKDKKKIDKFLKLYSIPNLRINSLSKGTIQKALLLATTLEKADLYVFDEPLDGLDIYSKNIFIRTIKNLISDKKTVVISTHHEKTYELLSPFIVRFGDKSEL